MSTIKIDKGVPIPNGSGGYSVYPWAEMEVGDSFFAPVPGLSGSIAGAARKYGWKFRTQTTVENGIKGVRVWRKE